MGMMDTMALAKEAQKKGKKAKGKGKKLPPFVSAKKC